MLVDKTRFIEVLENSAIWSAFIVRPPHFGKRFLSSQLRAYYDCAAADDYESSFSGTYIDENKAPQRSSFYVLQIDFSGIKANDAAPAVFAERVVQGINDFYARYPDAYSEVIARGVFETPSWPFLEFLNYLPRRMYGKIYIIVDGYDDFAHRFLLGEDGLYQSCVRAKWALLNFFANIKDAFSSAVERAFVSGTVPVSMDGPVSGYAGSFWNLSDDPRFEALLGLTDEEADYVVSRIADAQPSGISAEGVLQYMKHYFGGYHFVQDGKNDLLNPSMVFEYLNRMREGERIEARRTVAAADLKRVFARINRDRYKDGLKILENIARGGKVKFSGRMRYINVESVSKAGSDLFLELMFHFGFLSFSSERTCHSHEDYCRNYLVCPNETVRSVILEGLT